MKKKIIQFFFLNVSLIFIGCFTFTILLFLAVQFYSETNLTTKNLYSANLFLIICFIIIYVFFFLNILKPFNFIENFKEICSRIGVNIYLRYIHNDIRFGYLMKENYSNIPHHDDYKTITYFMFYILPKIIVSIALFIDIVYLNKIHYLYLILTILWVPLLFHIMTYILFHWADFFRALVLNAFEIRIEFKDNYLDEVEMTQIIPQTELLFSEEVYLLYYLIYTETLMHRVKLEKESKNLWVKYLNLIIYTMFFFIWSYVLYLTIM